MFLAVDFDIPLTNLAFLLHLFLAHNQLPFDSTPNVECLLACEVIALDAGALFCLADTAYKFESAVV